MKIATECLTSQQLQSLTFGELSLEDSEALFQHIADCPQCSSALETVEDVGDSLIAHLRKPVGDAHFRDEPDCRLAVVKALGALANSENEARKAEWDKLPKIFGEYEIVREIGSGGMGNVFLARHTKLGREVALKLLANHRLADSRSVERFEAEMRAIGRLSHPNIVTAHDARDVDGTAVLITEYVSGLDLGQLLRRTGALKIAEACEIARRIAIALAYTNSQGFVHRDLKPSNVMLSDTGEIKLLDLGLARLQYGEKERTELTGTGQAMGTADYIAPEQVADSKTVDIRADIYSLGCTLFKLLTGCAPFADAKHITPFSKMTAHVSEKPPSLGTLLPSAPRGLVLLVDKMLAKKPADRPATPQDVATALAPHCQHHDLQQLIKTAQCLEPRKQPLADSKPSPRPATLPWRKRTVPRTVAVAAGFLGFLLGIAFSIIIVITNPDGTKTILHLAEGSKVEIREGGSPTDVWMNSGKSGKAYGNESQLGSASPDLVADSDSSPLQFGILVNCDSPQNGPYASEAEILEATKLLKATDGNLPVQTPFGTWHAIMDNTMEAPIQVEHAGKKFALVSIRLRWPSIAGHTTKAMKSGAVEGNLESHVRTTIILEFDQALDQAFAELSRQNINNQLAFIVHGTVRSAAMIRSELKHSISMNGRLGQHEALQLVQILDGHRAAIATGSIPNGFDLASSPNRFQAIYYVPLSGFESALKTISKMLEDENSQGLATEKAQLWSDKAEGRIQVMARSKLHEKIAFFVASLQPTQVANESSLKALQLEYATLSQTLGKEHPSLRKVTAQMEFLQSQDLQSSPKETQPPNGTNEARLLALQREYAELSQALGKEHPSLKKLAGQIELLQNQDMQSSSMETQPPKETNESRLQALQSNLKKIGIAIHSFESTYKKFPGTSNTREGSWGVAGQKIYPFSWRVAILPYIEQAELYQEYHFNEPWDSEHNLTLLDRMPAIYRSPLAKDDQKAGETNILGFATKNSALGEGGGEKISSFTDGLSNTLLLIETSSSVPWTKPQDLSEEAIEAICSEDRLFTYLIADADVKSGKPLPREVFMAMLNRNDGIIPNIESLEPPHNRK